jgi:hypothetical protein
MRHGHSPRIEGYGHRFGVESVVLATVLTHADLLDPRRVQHHRLLAPARQHVVHMPALPARLERHLRRRSLGAQQRLELTQPPNARSTHHLARHHLAKSDVASPQIQPYASHD